jgi:galacturan 1,4-alpha-galacturonidase
MRDSLIIGALASFSFGKGMVIERSNSSCTFTDADSAISEKGGCTEIVLKDIEVPAGTTLDMTGLQDGTHVG